MDIFLQDGSYISSIKVDTKIEEMLSAESEITSFPVEKQADINDHIILKPYNFKVKVLISDYYINIFNSITTSFTIKKSQKAIEDFLDLRVKKTRFDLLFGDKVFKNIVIKNIEISKNKKTQAVAQIELSLQEVNMIDISYQDVYLDQTMSDRMSPLLNTGIKESIS